MNIWVVTPAFNEGEVVAAVVREVVQAGYNIVVIDDGSTDDTADAAFAEGAHVLTHPINLGQGAALQTGFDYLKSMPVDYVVTFDADGQHCVSDIGKALEIFRNGEVDVVLGSRFLGAAKNMPDSRKYLIKAAVAFHRILYGIDLTDSHNGFRVLSAQIAQRLQIRSAGMAHATELVRSFHQMQARIVEMPVTIRYTDYSMAKGQKMSSSLRILKDLFLGGLFK